MWYLRFCRYHIIIFLLKKNFRNREVTPIGFKPITF